MSKNSLFDDKSKIQELNTSLLASEENYSENELYPLLKQLGSENLDRKTTQDLAKNLNELSQYNKLMALSHQHKGKINAGVGLWFALTLSIGILNAQYCNNPRPIVSWLGITAMCIQFAIIFYIFHYESPVNKLARLTHEYADALENEEKQETSRTGPYGEISTPEGTSVPTTENDAPSQQNNNATKAEEGENEDDTVLDEGLNKTAGLNQN